MVISINSNISALRAERQLGRASDSLTRIFERLSSGQRINHASDDAAGLAIATSLNTSSRIFTQGVRNINDSISMLSIAEGAAQELTGILIRIKELAEQSANGAYSTTQRSSLNSEAQALREEFNRVIQTTEFNDIKLLDGSSASLQIQAGGNSPTGHELFFEVDSLATAGDGTFQAGITSFAYAGAHSLTTVDLNGDGFLDLVLDAGANSVGVAVGNGDGSFNAPYSFAAGDPYQYHLTTADVNFDGIQDILTTSITDSKINIFLGNGDATFKARVSYAGGSGTREVAPVDINKDGILDLLSASHGSGRLYVLIGNGDGTFQAGNSYSAGSQARSIATYDLNGDGNLDVVTASSGEAKVNVLFGNGDGSFRFRVSYVGGTNVIDAQIADINYDGVQDIIAAGRNDNVLNVLIGNGDGSFKGTISYDGGTFVESVTPIDINNDGILDVVTVSTGDNSYSILIGNGDGTFRARTSFATGVGARALSIADLNGDEARDLIIGSTGDDLINVHLGNGAAQLKGFNIRTVYEALNTIQVLEGVMNRVSAQVSKIGVQQSRLQIAAKNLAQSRENYQAAEARITNADIAEESSRYSRIQILQQAASSVLAQANQLPALALRLLQS